MPISHQLTSPVWLSLAKEVRAKMVTMFGLKRTGRIAFTQVNGKGELTSDGYTHADLSAITLERMREFVSIPEGMDFWKAFEVLLAFVEKEVEATAPKAAKPEDVEAED